MTKHKDGNGPADAANNGQHVAPGNSSRSLSRGGSVISEALRGAGDMHLAGGCKNPGGEPSLDQQRNKEERAQDDQRAGG